MEQNRYIEPERTHQIKIDRATLSENRLVGSKLYAALPQNKIFHRISPQLIPQETYFEITLDARDTQKGTFTLVKDPDTLERAFALIDQLKSACDLIGTGQPNGNFKVETPGTVSKVGDLWEINQNLRLTWM